MRSTGITCVQINAITDTFMGSHYLTDGEQPAVPTEDLFALLRPHLPAVPAEVEALVASRTVESENMKRREVIGSKNVPIGHSFAGEIYGEVQGQANVDVTVPHTAEAAAWSGWGTALKPAQEPIVLARKPLVGTVAANVLAHGTGALNVDGCRIGTEDMSAQWDRSWNDNSGEMGQRYPQSGRVSGKTVPPGRWPANVIMDEVAAAALDEQSGYMKSGTTVRRNGPISGGVTSINRPKPQGPDVPAREEGGGASRFFYCAKTSRAEREAGLTPANMLCQCTSEELHQWLFDTAVSPKGTSLQRDTIASLAAAGSSWLTDGSGSKPTDLCLPGTTSTTSTRTSSTTSSATSPSSTGLPTSESTAGASSAPASGGSPATFADKASRLAASTGISAARDGRVTDDVGRATSRESSERNGIAVCCRCDRWCSRPSAGALTGGREEGSDGLNSPRAGAGRTSDGRLNIHSTVKPIALMRWLVRLVTPPGGVVLDPYCGSGSTLCAAVQEDVGAAIGIELTPEYIPIIEGRVAYWAGQREAS
jgi:hypothetical protein